MVRLRLVAPLLAGLLVAAAVPLEGAGADPIADKQAQAVKIADQIDQLNAKGEALAERYDATNQQLSDLGAQLSTTKAAIRANEEALRAAKTEMRSWALRTFVNAGSVDAFLTMLTSSPADELNAASLRQGYAELAVRKDQRVADELVTRRADATTLSARLTSERDAQEVLQGQLTADRVKVEATLADQNVLLAKVQGELQGLVAAEQARRAAEQERLMKEHLAAAAAARQAAADAAAAKAAAQAAARTSTTRRPTTTAHPTTSVKKATTTVGGPKAGTSSTAGGTTTVVVPSGSTSTSTSKPDPNVPATVPTPPASNQKAALAVTAAMSQRGVRYVFGGGSPATGFDCSGLTSWAWTQAGVLLPHNAAAQFALLPKVPIDQLQPGDLVFFGRDLHHVGLYIGNGQMVHAPFGGRTVTVASIYRSDLVAVGGRP